MEPKKLYKSREDRMICGVCGGLAEYFNVDSTLIRLGGALLACVSCGTGLVLYFVAAVIIPERPY
ncbi:MAG: PspC domain-containing protein [Bariatricus sp.]|nr:PspC domain-containing protein [Bariatricus sp.]